MLTAINKMKDTICLVLKHSSSWKRSSVEENSPQMSWPKESTTFVHAWTGQSSEHAEQFFSLMLLIQERKRISWIKMVKTIHSKAPLRRNKLSQFQFSPGRPNHSTRINHFPVLKPKRLIFSNTAFTSILQRLSNTEYVLSMVLSNSKSIYASYTHTVSWFSLVI